MIQYILTEVEYYMALYAFYVPYSYTRLIYDHQQTQEVAEIQSTIQRPQLHESDLA